MQLSTINLMGTVGQLETVRASGVMAVQCLHRGKNLS